MSHLTRKSIADDCAVCGMPAYKPCIMSAPRRVEHPDDLSINRNFQRENFNRSEPEQIELPLETRTEEIEYLSFEILTAARRLREIHPDSLLVISLSQFLTARDSLD